MAYDITTHRDFKKYYDRKTQRNIWVLGYFGSSLYVQKAFEAGKQFAEATNVALDSVYIEEISTSRRFKYFKYISSGEKQDPEVDTEEMDNVWEWLLD